MLYVSERKARRKNSFSGLLAPLSLLRRLSDMDRSEQSGQSESGSSAVTLSALRSEITITGAEDRYGELLALEHSGEILRRRMLQFVEGVALEALEYGAREVYIGHPSEDRYEFFVESRGYQGAIDVSSYYGLLRLFGDEVDLSIPLDWPDADEMQLSLTSNHANSVVHVTWRMRWLDASVMGMDGDFSQ